MTRMKMTTKARRGRQEAGLGTVHSPRPPPTVSYAPPHNATQEVPKIFCIFSALLFFLHFLQHIHNVKTTMQYKYNHWLLSHLSMRVLPAPPTLRSPRGPPCFTPSVTRPPVQKTVQQLQWVKCIEWVGLGGSAVYSGFGWDGTRTSRATEVVAALPSALPSATSKSIPATASQVCSGVPSIARTHSNPFPIRLLLFHFSLLDFWSVQRPFPPTI